MLKKHLQFGVTLIELLVGMAIVAAVLAMAAPSFILWIQNLQNHAAAESIQNGLQVARAEAVKRNMPVRFNFTDATGLVAWSVDCVRVTADCPTGIQTHDASESSGNVGVGVDTTPIPIPIPANQFSAAIAKGTGLTAGVTFEGMGRMLNSAGDITRIDVTNQAFGWPQGWFGGSARV